MGKNGAKSPDDFIELGGWEIRKVKDGLDEAQVTSLINELIAQRDELNQRTEHLSSLSKLAERTVTEADKLAREVKAQAIEQARNETANLIAEAEVKAQEIENGTKQIQRELKDSIQGLLGQLLSGLDSLKQQVETLQTESEQKLSQPLEAASPVTSKADETPVDSRKPAPAVSQTDAEEPVEKVVAINDQETVPDGDKLDLELEILPPLDIMKIMEIVTYLDNLPEIENTELIPNTERPSIIVSLREPINLTSMLRTLPEVANVEEAEAVDEGKPRKIQISLSDKSIVPEAKKG
jgi:hypothetical protein